MSEPNDRRRVVSDEERAKAMLEQLKGVHAVDIGRDMVIATVNFSYPKLGLSDETRPVRDLDDVRVSIELVRAILEVLEREHAGEKTSDLHDTLAQMQLAYAHAVQLANAERAASAAPEPQSEPAPEEEPAAEEMPAAEKERVVEKEPAAAEEPEAAKKPAGGKKTPATKKPAAKKPAAKRKPAAKKKPAGDS
jgi:hypothetical protein